MTKPVFRMSSAGYCPKRLSAMLLGKPEPAPPPSWLATAAEEGNWHEQRMKQELRALGCQITDEQKELRLEYPEFTLLGHIDGRIRLFQPVLDSPLFEVYLAPEIDLAQFMLLEVKSFSFLEHQRWLKGMFDAFPQYESQSAFYKAALGIESMAYVTKDRSGGARHLYVSEVKSTIVLETEKLTTIVQCATEGELAPAEFDPMSIECRRCPYRATLCSPAKVVVTDAKVVEAAADYLEGSTMKKLGTALTESAKDTLVAFAQQNGITRWDAGPYSVGYSHYLRESVSIKRLEGILPREQFDEAISVAEIDRVHVTAPKEEDA